MGTVRWFIVAALVSVLMNACLAFIFSLGKPLLETGNPSANVIAYYTFDGHAQDATANTFDGTAVNMGYSTDVPPGMGGQSAQWSDETVQRYIDLPVIRGLGRKYTVTCWLKTGNTRAGWLPVLANNVPQSPHMVLAVNTWGAANRRIIIDTKDDALNADAASSTDHALPWISGSMWLGLWMDPGCEST